MTKKVVEFVFYSNTCNIIQHSYHPPQTNSSEEESLPRSVLPGFLPRLTCSGGKMDGRGIIRRVVADSSADTPALLPAQPRLLSYACRLNFLSSVLAQ